MIPLKDDNPTHIKPVVSIGLIAACVLAFLWQVMLPGAEAQRMIMGLGAIPAVLFQIRNLPPEIAVFPASLDFLAAVTYMFLHGGWWHLLSNMLYLWVFGDNVEDAMGHRRFLAFYLLCGIAAVLVHGALDPASITPTVGASGAISGVLGAYVLLYPRAKVLVAFGFFILRVPAWTVLGLWFLMQILNVAGGGESNVAWWAHIGGFAAGMVLILAFKYRHVGLFGAGHLSQTAPLPVVGSEQSERTPRSGDERLRKR